MPTGFIHRSLESLLAPLLHELQQVSLWRACRIETVEDQATCDETEFITFALPAGERRGADLWLAMAVCSFVNAGRCYLRCKVSMIDSRPKYRFWHGSIGIDQLMHRDDGYELTFSCQDIANWEGIEIVVEEICRFLREARATFQRMATWTVER